MVFGRSNFEKTIFKDAIKARMCAIACKSFQKWRQRAKVQCAHTFDKNNFSTYPAAFVGYILGLQSLGNDINHLTAQIQHQKRRNVPRHFATIQTNRYTGSIILKLQCAIIITFVNYIKPCAAL